MPTTTPEQRAYEAAYFITNSGRFDRFTGYTYRSGAKDVNVPGLSATVKLVKVIEDSRDTDSYDGEYDMGSEGELGLIFRVEFFDGTTIHLKKEGYADSYGKEFWDGPFRIVIPQTKTVLEYVYE